ncbi:MAG: trypsin-like peptidase domain-containing protein [Desulfomonilaceae bacterium]|nr:trypsin-like peptidase domain-containing protein [Desulfomonilaceae bacterium]
MDKQNGQESAHRATLNFYRWVVILLLLFVAILIWRSSPFWPFLPQPSAEPRTVTPRGNLSDAEESNIEIFRKASPSVVHITTTEVHTRWFSLEVLQIPRGTGSGFMWDDKGYIVTNYHVIHGAESVRVTLSNHSTYPARIVGVHPDKDLAVLWINAPKHLLRPIPVGSSRDLQVGQKVYAIGNPFGLDQSLSTGIVSALGREIESMTGRSIKDVIQTDAAINPGNSGGPLLDSAGRLIGVNTAIFSRSGTFSGIGFAIPVDEVNRVVPQLARHGRIVRPALGVEVAPDQIVEQLGVSGVLIMGIRKGSPAEEAGLRATYRDRSGRIQLGDIITAIGEKKIDSVGTLLDVLENHRLGDAVQVTIIREGKKEEIPVRLGPAE